MKALNYRRPCDDQGKLLPWLNDLRNLSGCYVIRSRAGWLSGPKVLYVGMSETGRLAKTIKRHLYPWPDSPERQHAVYDKAEIEIAVRVTPPPAARGAEANLIRRLNPRDNGNGFGGERPF